MNYLEEFPSVPVYCDTIAEIERRGPVVHIVFAQRRSHCGDGTLSVAQQRIIVPVDALPAIVRLLAHPPLADSSSTDIQGATLQ